MTAAVAARLDLRFDPDQLAADLERLPDDAWIAHFNTQRYIGGWSAVPLRAPDGVHDAVLPAPGSAGAYADTRHVETMPAMAAALRAFRCPLFSVRLMKLDPGARILEHHDPDLETGSGLVRLHVPVRTHADVDFRVNGERITMAPGECWYLDLGRPHAVTNAGPTDRVHLVLDCGVDDWLRSRLAQAGVSLPAADAGTPVRPEDVPLVVAELRRMGTKAALEWARILEQEHAAGETSRSDQ